MQEVHTEVELFRTRNMLIKICGIRYPGNLREILSVSPDLLGFIFYSGSPRYVGGSLSASDLKEVPPGIKKVGVFADEKPDRIIKTVKLFMLDMVQLHGDESPAVCNAVKLAGVDVIKAFRIRDDFDFENTTPYSGSCKYLLFDSGGKSPGGNGIRFNWEKLRGYKGETPFFLSGGIKPESVPDLNAFYHRSMTGIDLNSGFETEPGKKEVPLLREFIKTIRQ